MLPSSTDIPTTPYEVLTWPLIFSVIGLIVWFIGLKVEFNTEKSTVKWLSLVPMAIGLFIGGMFTLRATDFAYQDLMARKLTLYAHYAALVIPLAAISFVIFWNWREKRMNSQGLI